MRWQHAALWRATRACQTTCHRQRKNLRQTGLIAHRSDSIAIENTSAKSENKVRWQKKQKTKKQRKQKKKKKKTKKQRKQKKEEEEEEEENDEQKGEPMNMKCYKNKNNNNKKERVDKKQKKLSRAFVLARHSKGDYVDVNSSRR